MYSSQTFSEDAWLLFFHAVLRIIDMIFLALYSE